MSDLIPFDNPEFGRVRVHMDEAGDPWWVASDVCRILELGNVSQTLTNLDGDEKGDIITADTIGRPQRMATVNEPGLYSLVLRFRKPEAKAFKRWLIHEVLPSIRKRGCYLSPAKIDEILSDPYTIIRLAT